MLLEFLMEAFSFMVLLFKGIAKSVWLGKVAMMLVKCPECGHEMSNGAKSCPRCGWSNAPLQAKRKLTRWMAITIVLSVFGVFWAFSLDQGQLYNRAGAYDIVVNGIPLQIVLSIPPVAAILAGVFNAASSSAGVVLRTVVIIAALLVIWAIYLPLSATGMFMNANGAGVGMCLGCIFVSISLIFGLLALRKLA